MVPEERRWKEKLGITRFYRAYSLTCPAAMQIYWNKRKCLHKKRVELPQDWFGSPTCPPSHCFPTPTWLPYVVICIRSVPYSGVLSAFWLLKFIIILNLLINKNSWHSLMFFFLLFNKILLTCYVSFTTVRVLTSKLNYDIELALILTENTTKFTFDIETCSANCPSRS